MLYMLAVIEERFQASNGAGHLQADCEKEGHPNSLKTSLSTKENESMRDGSSS